MVKSKIDIIQIGGPINPKQKKKRELEKKKKKKREKKKRKLTEKKTLLTHKEIK